ncbi:hypothetical protein TYRP_021930 [Tyrophagus putrescentiae]|nr:hypothetical protein TYRP_021930 [Tyrophagus putrescentiae]
MKPSAISCSPGTQLYDSKLVTPSFRSTSSSMKKLPVTDGLFLLRMAYAASAMMSTFRQNFAVSSTPPKEAIAAVRISVRGQSAFTAMERSLNSSAMPSTHIDMPHGVRNMLIEPLRHHQQRWAEVEDVRVGGFTEMWQGVLRCHKGACIKFARLKIKLMN